MNQKLPSTNRRKNTYMGRTPKKFDQVLIERGKIDGKKK